MKTPLVFKISLILVFALRLLKLNKKEKAQRIKKQCVDLSKLPDLKVVKNELKGDTFLRIKLFFRKEIKGKVTESQSNYLYFLAYVLLKYKEKGSYFKLFWHASDVVPAIYQSLVLMGLEQERKLFEVALKEISEVDFDKILNGKTTQIDPEAFLPDPIKNEGILKELDKTFNLKKYCEAVIAYEKH